MEKSTGRRTGITAWLVEPYRQVKLGLMFLLVNLVFSGIILSVFGYYILDMYEAMAGIFKLTETEGAQMLAKFQFPLIVGSLLLFVFILTTLFVSIRYTHQIYGPLVSILRFLDELLAGGRPKQIQLRSSDQLQELADKLNSVAERITVDERRGAMIAIHRFMDDLLTGKVPEKLNLRDGDQLCELANKLNDLAGKMPTPGKN